MRYKITYYPGNVEMMHPDFLQTAWVDAPSKSAAAFKFHNGINYYREPRLAYMQKQPTIYEIVES